MSTRFRRSALLPAALIAAGALSGLTQAGALAQSPGASGEPPAASGEALPSYPADGPWAGIDDGTQLTMWTRAATEARGQPLVDAYNASHKNQVELTIVPTDDYQAKVGAAAGSAGCRTCSRPTSCSCRTGRPRVCSPTSRTGSTRCRSRMIAPGAVDGVHLGQQEVRPAVRRRPVGLDVQQGAVPAGRAGPEPRSSNPRGVQPTRKRLPSWATASTAPSSAATAAAATCSPGGPSPGRMARKS